MLSKIIKNEEGYTIVYTLFLMVVISTLLTGFLAIIYYSNIMDVRKLRKKKMELACSSLAHNIVAGKISLDKLNQTDSAAAKTTALNNNYTINGIPLSVKTDTAGLYIDLIITAVQGRDTAGVTYRLGYEPGEDYRRAINTTRPKSPLKVAGSTEIKGNVAICGGALAKGNVFGERKVGMYYHTGAVEQKDTMVSKVFNESFLRKIYSSKKDSLLGEHAGFTTLDKYSIKEMVSGKKYIIDGDFTVEGIFNKKFYNKKIDLVVNGRLLIAEDTDCSLDMQIKANEIIIEKDVKIENAILVSKKGINVTGNSYFSNNQFFARDTVILKESVFNYPSTMVLYADTSKTGLRDVLELKDAVFNGTLMLVCPVVGLGSNKARIECDKRSIIKGIVYSENYFELKNKLWGSAYIYSFRYYKRPTEYINWLVNGEVKRNFLDESFTMPAGFSNNQKYKIIKEKWNF